MKNLKRIASLVLALVMVFSLAIGASAATGTSENTKGSITIEETAAATTYNIYRIFELESFNTEPAPDGAYSYKVDEQWAGFFADGAKGLDYVTINEGYVTWKTNASAANFAADALKYADEQNITVDGTHASTTGGEAYTFSNLDLGYYLVESSLGALCALDTTNPNATVSEKNAGHNLDKDVKEDSTGNWGDQNDASIGEEVEFKATITISGLAKNLVMHDTMTTGLTYGGVTKVTKNDVDVAADGNYTVTPNAQHTNDEGTTETHTFDVVFSESFNSALKTGDVIVVYYKATVNEDAVVATAEVNKSNLQYDDNNGETHETPDSETKTFTWKIDVLKYANGDTSKVLAGAKFKLSTDEAGEEVITFTETDNNVYEVATSSATTTTTTTEITTDATGKFTLNGLDSGTYYLTETEAPVGYNKLGTVIEVKISVSGEAEVLQIKGENNTYETVNQVEVENLAGTELPSTGGMGTTLFYVFGGIMVLAAAVLLVTKKRMGAAE